MYADATRPAQRLDIGRKGMPPRPMVQGRHTVVTMRRRRGGQTAVRKLYWRVMCRSSGRLLLTCLLMVTTIDSAAAVCAYMCANRNEPALQDSAQTSHSCHEVVTIAGRDESLATAPTRCAPEPPALTPARVDASRFNRAIVL